MDITLIAIGTRMPKWVDDGFADYAKRLGRDWRLTLKEIPSPRRSNSESASVVTQKEGALLLAALSKHTQVVALDERGKSRSTDALANHFQRFHEDSLPVTLLIGGADGLSKEVLQQADETWSLSPLTFPHALVRVVVAEQIYRAYSLINNHPYHRA